MIVLWPHYFDSEIDLSREQKRQINRRAWKIWFARRTNIGIYIAVLMSLNLVLNLIPFVLKQVRGSNEPWHWPLALLLFVGLLIGAVALLQRYRFGPAVRLAVRELGYDICLRCGYWLKGLDLVAVRRCPECGHVRPRPVPLGPGDDSGKSRNGQDLDVCPTCAALVHEGDVACPECGVRIPAPPPPS